MLTLKDILFPEGFTSAILRKRMLDVGVYDLSDVNYLALRMCLGDILPKKEDLPILKQQQWDTSLAVAMNYSKQKLKPHKKRYLKQNLEKRMQYFERLSDYYNQVINFVNKYKESFYMSFQIGTDLILLLSQKPPEYKGKSFCTADADEGFIALLDFSEMEKQPTKLLIVS